MLNTIIEGFGEEDELSNMRTANIFCTFLTHFVSSRPEKTTRENLITSLFYQLHFYNVSSDALI